MKFLKKKRNRIILYIVIILLLIIVLPSIVLKLYINSDSFKKRISEEINKRAKFERLTLSYQIGEIGLFSGVEFLFITFSERNKDILRFQNCHLEGLEKRVILNQNRFVLACEKGAANLDYFERLKGSERGVERSGAVKRYDVSIRIDNFELLYKRMKAEFELNLKYSDKEKYADIELRDRYKIRVFDIDVASKSAKLSFKNIDIPFLLERYLGRYAGLVNGRLMGTALVKKNAQEINIEFNDISVLNMSISHPLIGERPFKINKFLVNGRLSLSMASGLVRFDEINVNVSEMEFSISGKFYKGEYTVNFVTKRLELNDLAAFFDGEEFDKFSMNGEIRLKTRFNGNINAAKKIDSIVISGEVVKPVQVSKRLNYLKSDFEYEFVHKNGKKRRVVVGSKNPDYINFSDIPISVYSAVVVSEDAGFFGHKGVEFKEIESAIMDNIEGNKLYLRGGSTITQQLVKNLFLSREKTLLRKMKELLLAIELDAALSKERILEIYLNGIEWGPGIFGIGAASRHYFGKEVKDLIPIEAAYLASVIPNPNRYYTYFVKNEIPEKWNEKIQNILYRMNLFGFLSDEEYNRSLSDRIVFDRQNRE